MWFKEIAHLDSYSRVGCIPQSENTVKAYQFNMNYKNLYKEKRPQVKRALVRVHTAIYILEK